MPQSNDPSEHCSSSETWEKDPVFLHATREAWTVLAIFGVFALYCLAASYWSSPLADSATGPEVSMIIGMPTWIFWGVFVPWGVANLVTAWFCFVYMKRDSLISTDCENDSAADCKIGGGT
ncbi:MAG: hypothetical protein KDB22_15335 [Planctomycetales bacterium]|nr:hypothetical protein [Planctomycetales bacterium]